MKATVTRRIITPPEPMNIENKIFSTTGISISGIVFLYVLSLRLQRFQRLTSLLRCEFL